MAQMLELSSKDLEAAIKKMLQWAIMKHNCLKHMQIVNLSKEIKDKKITKWELKKFKK